MIGLSSGVSNGISGSLKQHMYLNNPIVYFSVIEIQLTGGYSHLRLPVN